MSHGQQNLQQIASSGSQELLSEHKKQYNYIPGEKNGKWSDEQHMKYIVFIDFNKEKMRSKEKRRSNKFYKEMARFISTRNALQCRSHHQKLQEKYTYVNKIISIYKMTFDKGLYKEAYENLSLQSAERLTEATIQASNIEVESRQFSTQTDIQGVNLGFFYVNNSTIVVQAANMLPNYQYYVPNAQPYQQGIVWSGPTFATFNGE